MDTTPITPTITVNPTDTTPFYLAYGLNTNRESMRRRCPQARALGHARLPDWKFRFAYHADIVPQDGALVHGVLWTVTPECLAALDRLESYPHYYDRKIVTVEHRGRQYSAWTYYMQLGHTDAEPGSSYWSSLITGYREHGVPNTQMYRALRAAGQAQTGALDNKYDLGYTTYIR